ncbi:carboxypeptidase-like regulatory domain-containing protein [cf. Phormidesmis sp. LEGE 11477]|uniref:carboxypeptidase-like regulatory domain-containing protein n=1 Tax=cf. Phormidesmis sp. LEGE 11477 TaxID=1828680 RepID=UPI001881E19A|nr:carboxypeptidase-like regulatory domain-containing protein [cf. Phormidesmis sp. LEGE 11477]MBE9061336.1 carboxypeptidase regulatory-like domain-containing protein [cf. Phormidesmis sp. LEGE 11477]
MRTDRLKSLAAVLCLSVGLTVGLSVLLKVPSAQAHGAVVEVNPAAVEIEATFDTGEPMSDAQVLVYSPADLSTPVVSGQTDSEGRFFFSPDPSLIAAGSESGRWEVTVRKAGHGQATSFELGNGGVQTVATDGANGSLSRLGLQQWISMAAIIWGFVGTALFFKANAQKTHDEASVNNLAPSHSAAIAPDSTANVPVSDMPRSNVSSSNIPRSNVSGSDR